jgi:hypothetical protein
MLYLYYLGKQTFTNQKAYARARDNRDRKSLTALTALTTTPVTPQIFQARNNFSWRGVEKCLNRSFSATVGQF